MIRIEIGNSHSKILGLTSGPFNRLRTLLSYQVDAKATYFSGGYSASRYCIDKQGIFATGLLYRVTEFMTKEGLEAEKIDLRKVPTRKVDHRPDFSAIKPYPSQIEAADKLVANGVGTVSMPTGSGKSLVIALAVARLSLRTLIVVPSIRIRDQLRESLSRTFKDMSNIVVKNIDSTALKTAKDFDLLVIDESHRVAARTYQKLNKGAWANIYHRLFVTATPFRNQTEETLLFEGIAGQVIYKLSYKDAVKAGYVVPIEAYFLEIPKTKTEAITWSQVYSELVVNNKARNQKIADLIEALHAAKVSTLCLVKEINHGEILAETTGGAFVNGQDEDTRAYIDWFNSGKLKTLIGTTGIMGEGIDSRPCEYVIISGLGKAKSAFMQAVGRSLRIYPGKESGKVIIIKDGSHKFLRSHFNEQCAILLSEYGVIATKLDV